LVRLFRIAVTGATEVGEAVVVLVGARGKRLMGFEPTTFCMASRRSSQLSYSRTEAEV
jgi:hypothetical protein